MDEPPMPDSAVMQGLDAVPATPEALEEALALSAEILADIELSRGTLTSAALKSGRLARLLNDQHAQLVFQYEAGGYPAKTTDIPLEVWELVIAAGRTYEKKDDKTDEVSIYGFTESIEQLEDQVETGKIALHAARVGARHAPRRLSQTEALEQRVDALLERPPARPCRTGGPGAACSRARWPARRRPSSAPRSRSLAARGPAGAGRRGPPRPPRPDRAATRSSGS